MIQKLECSVKAGPTLRKTAKKRESLTSTSLGLIGIVPQGAPDRSLSRAIERQLSDSNHGEVYSLGSRHAASR